MSAAAVSGPGRLLVGKGNANHFSQQAKNARWRNWEEEVDEATMAIVASRINGFSGREISKLFTSLQTHVLYSDATHGRPVCTRSMLLEVVDQKVAEHGRSHEFQTSGYEYQHHEAHRAQHE
ncbi:atad-3, partial [Symbiodinium sp. KB8]